MFTDGVTVEKTWEVELEVTIMKMTNLCLRVTQLHRINIDNEQERDELTSNMLILLL